MKVTDWLEYWLDNCCSHLKWSTIIRYTENIKCHIRPSLGDKDLDELTQEVLQGFIRGLTKKGLSYNTIASISSTLKSSVREAVRTGKTKTNNTGSIRLPERKEKDVECFTMQEQKRIAEAVKASGDIKLYGILISACTGLRIGELLALTWEDVDLSSMTICICKTCYFAKDKNGVYSRIVTRAKTRKSARTIPIPGILLPYIKTLHKQRDSKYVISYHGRPVKTRSYQNSFSRLLDKLGIPHRGFHALRHTFATRALECGIDAKTTSEILGHSSINITLQRYTHVLMEHMRKELGKLDEYLHSHDSDSNGTALHIMSSVQVRYSASVYCA